MLQQKRLQKQKNQENLIQYIFQTVEAKVNNKFTDKELDRQNEIKRLLESKKELWELDGIKEIVLKQPRGYEVIYYQEYYQEIFRLKGWKYEGIISQKPWVVGKYTNEIIYYRFGEDVLPFLRIANPYILPGLRKYKHHQFFKLVAKETLKRYIDEAVEVMKTCNDWYEFRVKLSEKYNVPYQVDMFEESKK